MTLVLKSPFSFIKNKDDCKTKLEIKEDILDDMEVQRGIEIMDKLDVPTIKNEVQDDFKAKIKVEKDIKKLQKKTEPEIQDELKPKIEIKEEIKEEMEVQKGIEIMDKLDVPIKNEVQDDFKAKIKVEKDIKSKLEMKRKNEIHDGFKPKIELKFEEIKEEMQVQRGMDIIEKLDPPTKKLKLSLEMAEHQKNQEHLSPKNQVPYSSLIPILGRISERMRFKKLAILQHQSTLPHISSKINLKIFISIKVLSLKPNI